MQDTMIMEWLKEVRRDLLLALILYAVPLSLYWIFVG
jgi:hypothetical protein